MKSFHPNHPLVRLGRFVKLWLVRSLAAVLILLPVAAVIVSVGGILVVILHFLIKFW